MFIGKSAEELCEMPLFQTMYEKATEAILCLIKEFGTDEILTPCDIFNLSKKMNIELYDFCAKYVDMPIAFDKRIPLAKIKPEFKDTPIISTCLAQEDRNNYSEVFQNVICRILDHMILIKEESLTDQKLGEIILEITIYLYFAYEREKDFFSQFQRNTAYIYKYLEDVINNS